MKAYKKRSTEVMM